MEYNFNNKPNIFSFILMIIVMGVFLGYVYSTSGNFIKTTAYIIPFLLLVGITKFYFDVRKCIYIIPIILLSGAISGICYWYVSYPDIELIKSILYGASSGFLWMIIESLGDREQSCT